MSKSFFVYILASQRNGTLYTGVTSHLAKRVWEHKQGVADGFSKEHGVKTLVYYEHLDDAASALQREKTIKRWTRQWKINAIEKDNPTWRDLYDDIQK